MPVHFPVQNFFKHVIPCLFVHKGNQPAHKLVTGFHFGGIFQHGDHRPVIEELRQLHDMGHVNPPLGQTYGCRFQNTGVQQRSDSFDVFDVLGKGGGLVPGSGGQNGGFSHGGFPGADQLVQRHLKNIGDGDQHRNVRKTVAGFVFGNSLSGNIQLFRQLRLGHIPFFPQSGQVSAEFLGTKHIRFSFCSFDFPVSLYYILSQKSSKDWLRQLSGASFLFGKCMV